MWDLSSLTEYFRYVGVDTGNLKSMTAWIIVYDLKIDQIFFISTNG